MEQQSAFEESCERYLFGELSESERERFEEAYFEDDALFERFLAVKDELLDLYARGELAEEKRARFARHFPATAPRRRQIGETEEFIRVVTAVSTRAAATDNETLKAPLTVETPKSSRRSFTSFFNLRPFAWQFALGAIILVSLFGVWIFFRSGQKTASDELVSGHTTPVFRSGQQPDGVASGQPTPAPTTAPPTNESENTDANNNTVITPSPIPANSNQPSANTKSSPQPAPKKTIIKPPQISPAQIASVLLLPVASRDINDSNTLRLDSETRTVRLRLVFKGGDYRNFSAEITTVGGASVWRQSNLRASNKSVTLQLAPALLRGQEYIVTLKGQTPKGQTETVGEYYFRVERIPSPNTPKRDP